MEWEKKLELWKEQIPSVRNSARHFCMVHLADITVSSKSYGIHPDFTDEETEAQRSCPSWEELQPKWALFRSLHFLCYSNAADPLRELGPQREQGSCKARSCNLPVSVCIWICLLLQWLLSTCQKECWLHAHQGCYVHQHPALNKLCGGKPEARISERRGQARLCSPITLTQWGPSLHPLKVWGLAAWVSHLMPPFDYKLKLEVFSDSPHNTKAVQGADCA